MVYPKRIPKHFQNGRSDKIRILFAMEFVREVKLPYYRANPIELRRREFHQSLRKGSKLVQMNCHCSPL